MDIKLVVLENKRVAVVKNIIASSFFQIDFFEDFEKFRDCWPSLHFSVWYGVPSSMCSPSIRPNKGSIL